MLHPYNILKPITFEALNNDEYIIDSGDRIMGEEDIINLNIDSVKEGKIILPVIIKDIDASTFFICDAFGVDITAEVSRIETSEGWEDISLSSPIDNSEPIYSLAGTPFYVVQDIPEVLYNRTFTGSPHYDAVMLSETYYKRLEYLYNSRFGSSRPDTEEIVISFDQETGDLVTDIKTRVLSFPLSATLEVDDVLPAGEFIDKVVNIAMVPPYVNVTINAEYGYLRKLLSFDSNKLIILED